MKRLIITILLFAGIVANAFSQVGGMEERDRLAIGVEYPVGLDNDNMCTTLQNNITQALVLNGLSATDSRFTVITKVAVLSKDVTRTAPAMYVTELELSMYIADMYTGVIFSMATFSVKGVADSDAASVSEAVKQVKARNSNLRNLIQRGKTEIMKYFEAESEQILMRIDALIASGNYRSAIIEINSIPRAAADLYNQASVKLASIPAAYINTPILSSDIYRYYNTTKEERIQLILK